VAVSARKKRRETAYSLDTCVVRVTTRVKEYFISKGKWGESFDQILRRLHKLGDWEPPPEKKDTNKRRNSHGR